MFYHIPWLCRSSATAADIQPHLCVTHTDPGSLHQGPCTDRAGDKGLSVGSSSGLETQCFRLQVLLMTKLWKSTHTHLVWAFWISKELSQNRRTWEGQDLLHCSHSRNKLRPREMLGSIPTLPVHAWHSGTMAMNQSCRENTNHSFSTVEVWCYQAWKSSTKTEKLISWNESSLKTGIYSLNFLFDACAYKGTILSLKLNLYFV